MSIKTSNTQYCFRWFTALCLLLTASVSYAQTPLTPELIEKWLASADAIHEWTKKNSAILEKTFNDEMKDNPKEMFSTEKMTAQLKASGLYSEAKDLMKTQGFDTPEEWIETQMRIFKAVMAVELDGQGIESKAAAQLQEIKNNPSIPAEQKEMMVNMIESSMKMMTAASKAPEADRVAVQPYMDKIKQKIQDEAE